MSGDNNIPKGWVETVLDDVCYKVTDGSHQSPRAFKGGFPMLSVKDMNEFGFDLNDCKTISPKDYSKLVKQGCKPEINDVLIAKDGSVLKHIFRVKEELQGVLLSSIAIVKPNINLINPAYLVYLLTNPLFKKYILNNFLSGSGVPRIVLKDFKRILFQMPPLPEQQAIASILTSFDDKIELLQAQNETLEATAQTIFKEWFGKYQVGDELPEGWRVGKLGEEFNITMGQSPPGKSYNTDNNGTVFFQGRAEFTDRFPEVRLYTTEPKRMADKFDVLVSVRAPVGDINVALDKCCIGRGLAAVSSNYKSYCLYKLKSLKPVFDLFESEGTVFGSINKTSFSNIEVVIPDDSYVKDLDSTLSTLDMKIYNNYLQIQTLQQTRDTLLPKLMSGKLRVEEFREIV